jgi:CubicO group peptidase (beta-lactamase class C family)
MVAALDTQWNYNGGGVDLLGAIIARQSKQPLDVFAREALFAPLGSPTSSGRPIRTAGFRRRLACVFGRATPRRSVSSC